jgi:hypothetical protein
MSPAHRSFADPNGKIYPSYFLFRGRFGTKFCEFPSIFFHGTEFGVVFSSAEGFGTEFREFLFRGTAGIPSELTISSVYSVFRGIIFLSEIPNPICKLHLLY